MRLLPEMPAVEKLMSKYDKSEAEEAVDAALEHAEQEKEMERKEGE